MQELQQIKNSLEQNEHLTEEAKNTIFLLLQEIIQKMEQEYHLTLPTHLLIERLQTASVNQSAEFMNKEIYQYNIQENKIYLRSEQIKKGQVSEINILTQSLLEMAYIRNPKKAERGINGQEFVAIKKGIIEILANNLVGNSCEKGISEDEQVFVNMANIISNNEIMQAFFEQDNKKLETIIMNKKYSLLGANGLANYNAVYSTNGDSQLGNIEMQLIDSFFKLPAEEIKERLFFFESHIISNPNIMGRPNKYNHLIQIETYFQKKKHVFLYQKTTNQIYTGSPNTQIPLHTGYDVFNDSYEQPEMGHSKAS